MRENGETGGGGNGGTQNDEIAELKFYIPEDMSGTMETEGIVKLLLNQFKEANLLEAIDGIQRYRNVVELTVFAEYRHKFLKTPITWCRCASYLVTENEPIIIINIYAARLTSRWTDLVNKFNEFGKVVIYYDLKENYNGHEVKTGVRSIWLKDVIKRPKELTQGNRKLRVVYDKDIMNKLLSIGELAHEAKGGGVAQAGDSSSPADPSNPSNVIKDELEAKFANLLKASNLHQEDGEAWEQPGPSSSSSGGGDSYGLFSDLKGQLETIEDTEEPPETPEHRSRTTVQPVDSSRGKQKMSKEAPLVGGPQMQQAQLQPQQLRQRPLTQQQQPLLQQQQQPLQQLQQPSGWRNETTM